MKNYNLKINGFFLIFLTILFGLLTVRSGRYTIYVNLIYFFILFVSFNKKFSKISLLYFTYFLFLLALGLLNNNNINSILEDIFSFWPLILFFFTSKIKNELKINFHNYLANSLYYLLPLCLVIFNYMDYGIGSIITKRFNYDSSTNFELFAPIIPIIFAPYLIFYFKNFNRNKKLVIILSNAFIFFMGVITLSRSVSFGIIIPFFLILIHKISLLKFTYIKKIFKYSLVLSFGLIFVVNSSYFRNSDFKLAFDGVVARSQENNGLDFSSGRFDESAEYFRQDLSYFEIFFGKGLGGHKVRNNNESFIGGINMIHFGPVHLFMKGGVLMCLLIYLPLLTAIYWFWNTNNFSISLSLLYFLTGNLITTNWTWGIVIFIFWYYMSIFFDCFKFNKSLPFKN